MPARITPAHLDEIIRRAATDPAFRTRLLGEPAVALNEALGEQVPSNVRVRFIEKPAEYDALIVLPDAVATRSELSDRELEAVAGGAGDGPEDLVDTCGYSCHVTCNIATQPGE